MIESVRVLLVDDEALLLSFLSKVLRVRGFEVGTAAGGAEALAELGRERYDVVVLDQRMPGMDGIATLERIRDLDARLPVIFLSGLAEMSTAVEAVRRGAVDYLMKPASVDKLCEKIRSSAQQMRALKEPAAEPIEGE